MVVEEELVGREPMVSQVVSVVGCDQEIGLGEQSKRIHCLMDSGVPVTSSGDGINQR